MNLRILFCVLVAGLSFSFCFGDHPFAHTHIGVNPTWRPDWSDPGNAEKAMDTDLTDDDQLWFFSVPPAHPVASTPGWPNWNLADGGPFLTLTPYLDGGSVVDKGDGSGKILWECNFYYSESGGYGDVSGFKHLDGWHSAHGPQGKWNLASVDENTEPSWDIGIERVGSSVLEDDFYLFSPRAGAAVLTSDGDTYLLEKEWLGDKNAWGIHEHMSFWFWLAPGAGQEVSATFTAYDAGGVYETSDEFEIEFVTVPEPSSLIFVGLGIAGLVQRKRK